MEEFFCSLCRSMQCQNSRIIEVTGMNIFKFLRWSELYFVIALNWSFNFVYFAVTRYIYYEYVIDLIADLIINYSLSIGIVDL